MNMKSTKFLMLMVFLLAGVMTYGQQEPQVTQNMFNKVAVNPGYAGMQDAICVTGLVRQQWTGFKDNGDNVAPQTFIISGSTPLKILHGGVGAVITQDKVGYYTNTGVELGYSYHTTLGYGDLGIGLQVGFTDQKLDFGKFRPVSESDPMLSAKSEESAMLFDLGFGAYYKVPESFSVGFSTSQLLESSAEFASQSSSGQATEARLKRHYYLMGGYEFVWPGNPAFVVEPSLFIKTDFASTQYDVNGMVTYNNKFWGGVTYRVQDAVAMLMGIRIKDLMIGYSYDLTTSRMTAGSSGSHEVVLRYCFKLEREKIREGYRNTRFL